MEVILLQEKSVSILTLDLKELFVPFKIQGSEMAYLDDPRWHAEQVWANAFEGKNLHQRFLVVSNPAVENILFHNRELLSRFMTVGAAHQRLFWKAVRKAMRAEGDVHLGEIKTELRLVVKWSKNKMRTIHIVAEPYYEIDGFVLKLED